jgi:uncharacterized protein YraI
MKGLISTCALGATALTLLAGAANAAPATVASNTNLRQGPGTNFPVIMTVPGGSVVDIIRCGGEWCNVMANGQPGYMIGRNLGRGGPAPVAVVAPPPVVVVGPGPYYPYGPYYGPRRFYGPGFYYGPRRYWRRW